VDTAPELTRRERDVLHALCRPLASAEPFSQPASLRAIAKELVVTDAAVKQHLLRLYDKFGLTDRSENRRIRLANEAIARGVITLGELNRLREAAGR
jgi:DNA-binding NarL/FixJ family response regulator